MAYTNSSLVGFTQLSPNRTKNRTHSIDTITIHCYVGQVTVERMGAGFAKQSAQASSNYGVGYDGRIGLFVEEKDRSWCSSSASNDHRAITIEVASDTASPYRVTDAAYAALLDLVTDICKRNGIQKLLWQADKSLIGQVDKQNMTVHRWFAAKSCPGDYLYGKHGEIAAEVNKRLNGEETQTTSKTEDETMDVKQFGELFAQYRQTLQDNDSAGWSKEARAWAVEKGLITGNGDKVDGQPNYMWEELLSREQLVTVLYRFAQLMGKA